MTTKPLFPWIGGKSRLARRLFPLFPEHLCYVEPFAGAAALFFSKEPAQVEVINDINGDLINLYRIVQNHLEEFIRHFKWVLTSREQYEKFRNSDTELLTDIQKAVRFYYLQKLGFGGHVEKRSFGISPTRPPRLNLLRIEEDLSSAHLRLSGCVIEVYRTLRPCRNPLFLRSSLLRNPRIR
jgi:DNA adenine methylase